MRTVEVYADRAIPATIRRQVIARDGMTCRRCRVPVVHRSRGEAYRADTLHLDHVVPWAEGGDHTIENLIVSCADCNLSRPRPTNVVRQGRVRVRYENGTYRWDQEFTPPLAAAGRRRDLRSVRYVANALGLTPANVITLVVNGHLPATPSTGGPIAIEVPPWLMGSRVRNPATATPRATAAMRLTARRPKSEAYWQEREEHWATVIAERRARERAAREARALERVG